MKRNFGEILIKVIHLLIITGITVLVVNCNSYETSAEKNVVHKIEVFGDEFFEIDRDSLYDSCIIEIKRCESFSEEIYLDNDGHATIGYGHHIKGDETFSDKIGVEEASSLLEEDFNTYLHIAEKYVKDYNKQLAIGMFMFNVGEGRYKKSRLKIIVDCDLPIDNEIVKWCHYRSNGVVHESSGLLKRREFELSIYNVDNQCL